MSFSCRGADLQVKTQDGQTVQGEYLGTANDVVKIRTAYGVVSIPSKNVVSITAVATTTPKAAEAPADSKPDAKPGLKKAEAEAEPQKFKEAKRPNFRSLEAARGGAPPVPPRAGQQELSRSIRNFIDSNAAGRGRILRTLQSYGRAAHPYIAAAYNDPADLPERMDLLRALDVAGQPFTATIFADAHADVLAAMGGTAQATPPPPADFATRRERERPPSRDENLRLLASYALSIEGYASTAGGPFNALFLLEVYRGRYGGETTDRLLGDAARDGARLAASAADVGRKNSAWTGADRVLLAELAFPLAFSESEDLKSLARELLKKILPASHPKWEASEDEWVEWWKKGRETFSAKR